MKNFKKVIALVLAFAMLLSTTTVAFAADAQNTDKAAVLNQLGLFAGTSTTSFVPNLEGAANREQAMKVLALALGWDVDMTATTAFKDVSAWAVPYVAYAAAHNVTTGVSATEFGAKSPVTAKQLSTWVLRALGYPNAWTDLAAAATSAGVIASDDNVVGLNRDALVGVVYGALTATPVGGTKTLIASIVEGNATLAAIATTAGLIAAAPTALTVAAVTATNAKEVVVTFNKAVDETEGKKVANYSVKKADDTDLVVSGVVLSTDKTTATLTLTTAMVNYSTDNKVVVEKAVGLAAKYAGTVGVSDATIPTLTTVEATGPREITLTFSEPVQAAAIAAFKLDAGTVALGTVDAAGTKLKLTTLSDLAAGAHSLELLANSTVKDYVNLIVKPGTYAFQYVKDTTVPTVTVKESAEYTVTLKFSKNVTNVNTVNVLFSHTYDGQNQVVGNGAGVVTGSGDEYVVTFTNALAPGTSNIYVGYVANTTDANKIKDNFGNVLAATSLQVTTKVDSVAPVAEKVEFKSSTTAEVTFSEKVDVTTATTKANYVVKDSAAKAVTVSNVTLDGTQKIATVTFAEINAGGNYTVTIKDVKDQSIAKNKMAETTLTFVATDKVAPTISDVDSGVAGIQAQKVATKKVLVKFSEAMNATELVNKANYKLNAVALDADDTIVSADGGKAALITFKNDPTTLDLTVVRFADLAGNLISEFVTTVKIPAGVSTPLFDKAEVLTKNTVKLYFKEVITNAVAKDFAVDVSGGSNSFTAVTGIAVTVADGKTEIVLTTGTDIAAAAGALVNVQTVADASVNATIQAPAGSAVNAFGAKVDLAAATTTADKMASSIVTDGITTLDVNADGKIDHIKVVFDEIIFAGSVAMDKVTVAGYTVEDAYASSAAPTVATDRTSAVVENDTDIYIRVKQLDDADTGATPKVSFLAGLKDVAGNAFAAVADKASVDASAPVLVKAVAVGGFDAVNDTLTLTFSENVKLGDQIVATGTTLADLNDWLAIDLGGGTTDEALTSGGAPTFDVAVSGAVVTVTLKVAALTTTIVPATTDINVSDLSNILEDKATSPLESIVKALWVEVQ